MKISKVKIGQFRGSFKHVLSKLPSWLLLRHARWLRNFIFLAVICWTGYLVVMLLFTEQAAVSEQAVAKQATLNETSIDMLIDWQDKRASDQERGWIIPERDYFRTPN